MRSLAIGFHLASQDERGTAVDTDKKLTQAERIVYMLRNGPIKNHEFPAEKILNYTARIAELNASGYDIRCYQLKDRNGKATGVFVYHLLAEPGTPKQKELFKGICKKCNGRGRHFVDPNAEDGEWQICGEC